MPKGALEGVEIRTSAVALRDAIRELEIGLAYLKGRGDDVLGLLRKRDALDQQVAALEAEGMDLRPERTRIETIDNILLRKAAEIDSELASIGGLSGARRQENPAEERWWWYGDLYVAERRRKMLTRTAIGFLIVVVLLVGGNYLMDRFFGGTPQEKEARGYQMQAEQYVRAGEYDQAIAEYEKAVAALPSLGEAYLALGVLYEVQGEEEKSQQALAAAEAAYGSRMDYLMGLASAYQIVGNLDKAMNTIEEALQLEPESAQAVFIRGGINEEKGNFGPALSDYEMASDLAQQQGQDALYVLARTRMGMLLQRPPSSGTTPTSGS